jgi:hypothetical protein
MTKPWHALAREAALAAEHMASGVTALGRANYAQEAYYAQAFFALSIGFERSAKLALLVDHALRNKGEFPPNKDVRVYEHDLAALLSRMDSIAERLGLSKAEDRLPNSEIHRGIIAVLFRFSNNVTRYYNIDLITGSPSASKQMDPLREWFERVVNPICDLHYKPEQKRKHEQNALLIDELFAGHALVRHHSETEEPLNSMYEASKRTGMSEYVTPYVRLYVMQIVRFVARLLAELGYAAQSAQLEDIPYLPEFFAIFNNEDKYLKRRKTWSIYRP